MRQRFVLAGLGLGLAALTLETPAFALPSARLVFLRGPGTESCPSETSVRQAVQDRLGYDPFSSYAASTMLVEVSAAGGAFNAHLKLVDADNGVHGDRDLRTTEQCAELMSAMALTISIAIDPTSVTRTGPPDGVPPSERPVDGTLPSLTPPPPSPPPEPARAAPPEPEPPTRTPTALRIALGPLVSLGSAPGAAFGGVLAVEGQVGWFVAGLEGRADAPAVSRAVEPTGRVSSWLASGSLYAGARKGPVFAAAVGSLGRLAATSAEVEAARDTTALFAGAGALVGAAVPLTQSVELRARVEVLANLARHRLEISQTQVYEYPVASVNLAAGIAYRFW